MLVKAVSPSDLHNAYRDGRCPLCALNDRDERRYIDVMLYDQVTNVSWRAQIREARGFCAPHTTRILTEGRSALGVALIADDLVKTVQELTAAQPATQSNPLQRLRGAAGAGARGVAKRLRRREPCPLCAHLMMQTPVHARSLLQDLAVEPGRGLYQATTGLCLPHFVQTLEVGEPVDGVSVLVAHQQQVWQTLEGELGEFIRKNDYQWSGEAIGAERDAWRRAFQLLAGWESGQHLQ